MTLYKFYGIIKMLLLEKTDPPKGGSVLTIMDVAYFEASHDTEIPAKETSVLIETWEKSEHDVLIIRTISKVVLQTKLNIKKKLLEKLPFLVFFLMFFLFL